MNWFEVKGFTRRCKHGMNLVESIKRLCDQAGTSIPKLEKGVGFSKGSIYHWDKSSPSIDKVQKVAAHFKVPIDSFLSEEKALVQETRPLRCESIRLVQSIVSSLKSENPTWEARRSEAARHVNHYRFQAILTKRFQDSLEFMLWEMVWRQLESERKGEQS